MSEWRVMSAWHAMSERHVMSEWHVISGRRVPSERHVTSGWRLISGWRVISEWNVIRIYIYIIYIYIYIDIYYYTPPQARGDSLFLGNMSVSWETLFPFWKPVFNYLECCLISPVHSLLEITWSTPFILSSATVRFWWWLPPHTSPWRLTFPRKYVYFLRNAASI